MVSITVSVPQETRELMNRFPEINWSGFIRGSIEEKAKELAWKEDMLKKLKKEQQLSDWAVRAVRSTRAKRFMQLRKKGLI